jgi:DNA-directed RNA polymerase subunit RPC12/RpoP
MLYGGRGTVPDLPDLGRPAVIVPHLVVPPAVKVMQEGNQPEPYVRVVCPTCNARLHPRRELLGKRVRCPDCGVAVRVVEQSQQAVPVARDGGVASEYQLSGTDQPGEQPKTVLAVCGVCGARLFPKVELVGKRVRCPDCFKPVLVPKPAKEHTAKVARPVGEYRLDAEPAPNPLAAILPVTPPVEKLPLHEPEPPPAAPPRWWFLSGIFSFPWYPGTISRWMMLTIMSLFSNGVTAYGLSLMTEMASSSGVISGYGVGIKVASTIALGAIIWLIMMAYMSGCVVAVIRDTASGNDEVADWSDAEIYEGIWRIVYVVFPLAAAGAVGYAVYLGALAASPVEPAVAHTWAMIAATATTAILYPMMLVSALEQEAFWIVVSGTALRLIFGFWWGWLLVNIEAGLLTGAWWWLSTLGFEWSPLLTVILGAPAFAAVVLIDARLLGRFLYKAHDVLEDAHAADDEEDQEDEGVVD